MAIWKDKRKVMFRYNLTAEMYEERYAEEQKAKYKVALEKCNCTEGTVLDAGCGTGLFFNQIASKAKLLVGVDISLKLLAKAKPQTKIYENSFIVQADIDYLPFRENVFGAAFAFTVLQNMPKPSETLIELKRVASQDGRIVVTGLKKAFPETKFIDLLEESGLRMFSFSDNAELKCYIAVLNA